MRQIPDMSLMNRYFVRTVTPLAAIVTEQEDQMNQMEKSGGDRFAELEKKFDAVKKTLDVFQSETLMRVGTQEARNSRQKGNL